MVNAVRQLENGVSVDLVARDHGESYLRQREAGKLIYPDIYQYSTELKKMIKLQKRLLKGSE